MPDLKQQDKNKKKSVSWMILSLILGIVSFAVFFMMGDLSQNISAFSKIDVGWMLAAFALAFFVWLFESLTIHMTAKMVAMPLSLKEAFNVTMVGQFYNSVTPFASGGQPMQIHRLYKLGKDVSKSSAVMISRFLIYQATITVIGITVLALYFKNFNIDIPSFSILALIGFAINSFVIVFLLLFSFSQTITKGIFRFIIWFCSKFRFGKRMQERADHIFHKLEEFHDSMRYLKNHPFKMTMAFIYTIAQVVLYFSIPYCIYRMFGNNSVSYLEIFSFQGILFLVISFFPVPGASGAAEGGFYIFFKQFFLSSDLAGAALMWRLISYYLNIIAGVLFVIFKKKNLDGSTENGSNSLST